ncbi:MAG: hypothetical protein KKG95_08315, partial [Candidatus Omnitrophica bacterium]|nr:hypothetical protein [Candidatus Omnitrophota bacterium]
MKRKTEAVTGDIYEYLKEDFDPGTGPQGYGRITLLYDASGPLYRTYDWGAAQVTVEEYEGVYNPDADSDVRDDVIDSERTLTYIYDHNDEQVDLDTGSNGWIMRQKTVYGPGGTTMAEEYVYDADGRLTRDDHVVSDRYFTYGYHPAPDQNQVRYKYEYERSSNTLLVTYEYSTAGNLIGITYPGGAWIEKYTTPDALRWKREVKGGGVVAEYTNEYVWGDQWNHFGRLELYYNLTTYQTWDWIDDTPGPGDDQVKWTEFLGDYVPVKDTPNKTAIDISERRNVIVYDRDPALDGNGKNLVVQSNGWVEREKTVYDTDGVTVLEKYISDEAGRLIMEFHEVAGGYHEAHTYYEYEYHTTPGMTGNVRYKRVYSYNPGEMDDIIDGTVQGTFLASYEYIDTDYMIKRAADGSMTSFLLDGNGNSYNERYVDLSDPAADNYNVVHVFEWDDSVDPWDLLKVTKYYPDGKVEICAPDTPQDAVWPLVEKHEPANDFIKGGNLPWINYGYDLGSQDPTLGFSTNSNVRQLINSLSDFSGGAARVFIFTDLRDIINLSPVDPAGIDFYNWDKLKEDMNALLDAATLTGTRIIPCLFDFWLADNAHHPEVITDAAVRAKVIELMGRFVAEFAGRDEILMWDIMNEPYYGTASSGVTSSNVGVGQMRTFLTELMEEVRANDTVGGVTKDVTIGFAKKEFLDENTGCWHSFVDGAGSDDVDIVQIHYWAKYYWYGLDELGYSATNDPDGYFGGKPVLVGEIDPQYPGEYIEYKWGYNGGTPSAGYVTVMEYTNKGDYKIAQVTERIYTYTDENDKTTWTLAGKTSDSHVLFVTETYASGAIKIEESRATVNNDILISTTVYEDAGSPGARGDMVSVDVARGSYFEYAWDESDPLNKRVIITEYVDSSKA